MAALDEDLADAIDLAVEQEALHELEGRGVGVGAGRQGVDPGGRLDGGQVLGERELRRRGQRGDGRDLGDDASAGREGAEPGLDLVEQRVDSDRARDDEVEVVGAVGLVVEAARVVDGDAGDVVGRAGRGAGVGVVAEPGGLHGEPGAGHRVVLRAQAQLFGDHLLLAGQGGLGDGEVGEAVGFEGEDARVGRGGDLGDEDGLVEGGVGVDVAAVVGEPAREGVLVDPVGAGEHEVLEEVGEAALLGGLVGAAEVDPDLGGDEDLVGVGDDGDAQAVVEGGGADLGDDVALPVGEGIVGGGGEFYVDVGLHRGRVARRRAPRVAVRSVRRPAGRWRWT
ncbi:MAG: hypothetical protein R3F59_25695 [Myxococcota bacterium]